MPGFEPEEHQEPPHPDKDRPDQGLPLPANQRQLALVKKGHRYVFHYAPGQECELLERLVGLAHEPGGTLGMFDVAVLSHQLGRCLSQQLEQLSDQ